MTCIKLEKLCRKLIVDSTGTKLVLNIQNNMVIVTSLLTISRKSYAKVTSYSVQILEKTEGCSNECPKTPFRKSRET